MKKVVAIIVVVLSILSKLFVGRFTFQFIVSITMVFASTYYFHYPLPDNINEKISNWYTKLLSILTGVQPSSSFAFPSTNHHRYNRVATTMSPDGILPSHLNAAAEPFLQPNDIHGQLG